MITQPNPILFHRRSNLAAQEQKAANTIERHCAHTGQPDNAQRPYPIRLLFRLVCNGHVTFLLIRLRCRYLNNGFLGNGLLGSGLLHDGPLRFLRQRLNRSHRRFFRLRLHRRGHRLRIRHQADAAFRQNGTNQPQRHHAPKNTVNGLWCFFQQKA